MNKKQIYTATTIFLAITILVAGLLYYAQNRSASENNELGYDPNSIDFEPRRDPVLMIPGPDATEEERAEYEELVRGQATGTDTLYLDNCHTRPMVARMINPTGLRVVNDGDRARTLILSFGEYEIPANSTEYINIINDGGEGIHYYGCDIPLTAGVIIAEDIEI